MTLHKVPRIEAAPGSVLQAVPLLARGPCLELARHWPAETGRTPAQVWLGHADESLFLYARIPDQSIVTDATGPNQRMWRLGDTFEIFLQAIGTNLSGDAIAEYVELHVTPNNHRLQLRFASETVFRTECSDDTFARFLLHDPMFRSETATEHGGWSVFAGIRSEFVAGRPAPLSGQRWRFSFCRYDYDSLPGEPVLSSTSRHELADFHRIADWNTLEFE